MGRAGVLLDRDGTLIADSGYVGSVDRVTFLEGAAHAVAALNAAGLPVAVVTNQAGVARGYFGLEDVRRVHDHIDAELAKHGAHVDMWLFCPYHPDGTVEGFARVSADRKPAPGMALAAAEALDLDLAASWVVGDAPSDIGLARAVGAHALFIGTATGDPDVESVPDLASAVRRILRTEEPDCSPLPLKGFLEPRFPAVRYETADAFARDYTSELAKGLASLDVAQVEKAAHLLNDAYDRDCLVFACGNGGSASIANHLQCDHSKGVRNGTELHTRVVSLSANAELLSAIANDIGYESVFEYQLQSQARPGDVLIVVSSSGRSPNVVRALEWARANGMQSISMSGFEGRPARDLATVSIHVDAQNYGVVEDAHSACMHLLAQYVRQSRMSSQAIAGQTF